MRRYAPSNVVLCLSRGRPATLCFELIDCVDRQMDGQSIFAVPVKGRRASICSDDVGLSEKNRSSFVVGRSLKVATCYVGTCLTCRVPRTQILGLRL